MGAPGPDDVGRYVGHYVGHYSSCGNDQNDEHEARHHDHCARGLPKPAHRPANGVNDHERRLTRLTAEFKDAQATASSTNPAELETLVQSAITPVQACLDKELALAIKNAEAAMKSSFDTWAHTSVKTLNDTVDASIKAIEKKVDSLHGSSYGHITKTTFPEFARRIDLLEAHIVPTMPIPWDKADPLGTTDVHDNDGTVTQDGNNADSRRGDTTDDGAQRCGVGDANGDGRSSVGDANGDGARRRVLVMPMGTTDSTLTPEARLYGQRLAHAKTSTLPRRASQLPVPLGPLSTLWQVLEEL